MHTKPIHKIKKYFETGQVDDSMIAILRDDHRKGVQRLLKIYEKQKMKEKKLKEELMEKQQFDQAFRVGNDDLLAGVDEAGRGPLAGPVVAAAVILPEDFAHLGLNDSKQMTVAERNSLFGIIKEQAVSYSIAVLSAEEIDRINIFEATKKVMKNALTGLDISPRLALIDAMKVEGVDYPVKEIIKGDEKSLSIAAASVLAKVTRDRLMLELHTKYPMYDFKNNKGYGTKQHLLALEQYGPTIFHRKSFSPVQKAEKI